MYTKIKDKNKFLIYVGIFMITLLGLCIFLVIKNTRSVVINNDTSYSIDFDVASCVNLGDLEFYDYCLIEGELVSNKTASISNEYLDSMRHNTETLQELFDEASTLGKKENRIATIKLPSGIYYFISGGYNVSRYTSESRKVENVVINLKNNVRLVGEGIDESGKNTTLKPYSKLQSSSITKDECYNDYENCVYHGLDMFYFNDYRDYNQIYGEGTYLENVYFDNFIIDGNNVNEVGAYNSSGKGFMINLCKNCHWNNIIVENTAGTGFGMDNVINGSITNCKAINNGRRAKEWYITNEIDLRNAPGASGFGIGTGYSDDESMYIANCETVGNAKYGFFFEHQGRFNNTYVSTESQGFVVVNSISNNNMYNYGGERANDVVYINNHSIKGNDTISDVMFKVQSRRVYAVNLVLDNTSFTDVSSSDYYNNAVYWAVSNGIISDDYAELSNDYQFNPSSTVSRADALIMLWRMAGMPGDVLYYSSSYVEGSTECGLGGLKLSNNSLSTTCIVTDFVDVPVGSNYVHAVKWGLDKEIVRGNTSNSFTPNSNIKTNALVYFLYRYTNSFTGTTALDTEAFDWANDINLFAGMPVDSTVSSHALTKAEVVQMLYNYSKANGVNFPIYYALMGDDVSKVNNSLKTGWQSLNGNYWYQNSSGIVLKGNQTIDGRNYHFDETTGFLTGFKYENGKSYYYNPDGTQAKGVQYMTNKFWYFNEITGAFEKYVRQFRVIDISTHNGDIDWNTVKNSGQVDAVILRIGYGNRWLDSRFLQNKAELERLGIPYSVYLFGYAENSNEALQESNFFINAIRNNNVKIASNILPIYYDLESWTINSTGESSNNISQDAYGQIITTFIDNTEKNLCIKTRVYSNKNYIETRFPDYAKNYATWVAQWSNQLTYTGPYEGWQYTSDGSIPGINGRVDMSIFYY